MRIENLVKDAMGPLAREGEDCVFSDKELRRVREIKGNAGWRGRNGQRPPTAKEIRRRERDRSEWEE